MNIMSKNLFNFSDRIYLKNKILIEGGDNWLFVN